MEGSENPAVFVQFDSINAATEAKHTLHGKEVQPGILMKLFYGRKRRDEAADSDGYGRRNSDRSEGYGRRSRDSERSEGYGRRSRDSERSGSRGSWEHES